MLGCINKNSFRLLLISLQIVKANDSYLPLCSLMIFLKQKLTFTDKFLLLFA